MTMALYRFEGFLKKEKKVDTIDCIAPSEENAIQRCSNFATDLVLKKVFELSPGWEKFTCN